MKKGKRIERIVVRACPQDKTVVVKLTFYSGGDFDCETRQPCMFPEFCSLRSPSFKKTQKSSS
jgi:hypothetical protein